MSLLDKESLCLLLHGAPFLERRHLRALLQHLGGPRAVWEADVVDWLAAGLEVGAARELDRVRRLGHCREAPCDPVRQRELLHRFDARVIALGEGEYPPLLAEIPDPPPFLYLRGAARAMHAPQLAIVGSRKASPPGLAMAQGLARGIAAAGLTVTSGLALGIDAAAHRGALDAAGASVAVMATGVDQVYPRRHQALAESLLERGCLVSEFAPLTPPRPVHFPARNRIISGFSLGVLVVEAALPSGSLITAGTALDQGREVLAVPWFPGHAGGRGCLRLLRDGATLVESVEDILLALGAGQPQLSLLEDPVFEDSPSELAGLGVDERLVWERLGYEAQSVEALSAALPLGTGRLLAALTGLEMADLVRGVAGGYLRCR